MASKDLTTRTISRVGGHDLPIAVLAVVFFGPIMGVVDWRLFAVLVLVRALVWVLHARALLSPVRAYERAGERPADALLLAADGALQRFPSRFLAGYAGGWGASVALGLILGAQGFPEALQVGRSERALGWLLVGVLVLTEIVATMPIIVRVHERFHTELTRALLERRLRARRPVTKVWRRLLVVFVGLILAVMTLVAAIFGKRQIDDERVRVLEREQALVAGAALVLRRSPGEGEGEGEASQAALEAMLGEALDPSLRVVSAAELERRLGAERWLSAEDHGYGLALGPRSEEAVSREQLAVLDAPGGRVLAAAAVGDGRWVLGEVELDEDLGMLLIVLFGLGGFATIPVTITLLPLIRSVTEPLEAIDTVTRRVVEAGELGTLERVVALRNDEVGRLAEGFNGMLDVLEALTAAAVRVAKGDLRVDFEHPGELYDAFRGMVERLREVVSQIRETALELASAAAEIQAITQEQEAAAEQQSTRMKEISATVDGLAESAVDISERAAGVLTDADQAAGATQAAEARIVALGEQAAGIGELLLRIRDIADRSDLLALNGSLEATRAGEAGRGFALVAAETRRLAERVSATVNDVRGMLGDIEGASAAAVTATADSLSRSQSTADGARSISGVTQQQGEDTRTVSRALVRVTEGVSSSAVATSQTRAAAEGLRAQAEALEAITRQFEVD
ncbi:methyl-accepting chemotaxis protein [Pseudenhygromyxa sp. WMMC2535]|uniref:methyl-accepting chemotaxis protein n=1 Tax=Pseudenhygromyxa sp. WMMC2535 TaxID=2712867 RepID=UPI001554A81E|nr:methyl-accepting chemotaxis protein [Pseudenhygromyxa sp. WMMC2535]NVB41946.1 methyl-accepting chemotaxis protein [Pseudenhygromyxa sp. WMMC2535]